MWTKRILIFLPVAVCLLLFQSGLWVPTYEEQARATPERLNQYITASIGDAQILNPILHADGSSGAICNRVFEGLVDRDKDLNFRGRLAERWEIFEEAYFVVPAGDGRSPEQIIELLRSRQSARAGEEGVFGDCLRNISGMEIQPAETLTHKVEELTGSEEGEAPEPAEVTITVRRPPRIKLTLRKVDQALFSTLGPVLGDGYFSLFRPAEHIDVQPAGFADRKDKYAREFLPAVEHNPVIVFHLRKGVKFHDGGEFDAADVQFTYESIMSPKNLSPRVAAYLPVRSVEALDAHTVRVVYKELYSPALETWGIGILPEHLLNDERLREEAEERGIDFGQFGMRKSRFNRHPVGCGPFVFGRWESDEFITLDRFDEYWEGAPEYKQYVYRVIPDPVTQEMEFYAGAVDGYDAQPNQVERLKNDERFQNFSGLALGYDYIGYNLRSDLFKDRRVRRALGMAIDVDKIVRYVRYNQAERITGPFAKQTEYYDRSIAPLPYDPQGALRLLAEVGWERNSDGWLEKDGRRFEFTLITNNGNEIRRDILAVAQEAWRKIGVNVRTDTLEWAVFLEKHVNVGDFDAVVLGWSLGIDPDLYEIWHSSQSNPYQLNFVAFKNDEADDLIIRIRQEYDKAEQVKLCHRLHRIIADEQPYTFIAVGKWTVLLDKRVFVIRRDENQKIVGHEKIKATKTGDFMYDFNRWLKLPRTPELSPE